LKFVETALAGAWVIEPEPIEDERGFFARSFCREEFAARGLSTEVAQCNISHNRRRGTLRGMHYQVTPHTEAKLVRCTRGAAHDVILDLRRDSPTFGHWVAVQLAADNARMIYVPEGLAHGFQTLVDDTELSYQMSRPYESASARGVRWNDPSFGIRWPLDSPILSPRDAAFPDFDRFGGETNA
jgi:dTDP-4-dehydrorhamnose 3,5-epimerase